MQLNQLKRKTKNKKRGIVGRGGKRGKTSGRGTKGQNARAGNKRRPEFRDIIKKLPKMRGRGRNLNTPTQERPVAVKLSVIETHFSAGDTVNPAILFERGLIRSRHGRAPKVTIVSDGELTKKISFSKCRVTASARGKIDKAGGTVN